MIKEAIEKIEKLAEVKTFTIDGETYATKPLHIIKEEIKGPDIFSLSTLDGLIDYCKSQLDKSTGYIFHVYTSKYVCVSSKDINSNGKRTIFADATYKAFEFQFDRDYPLDAMIIKIQTQFIDTEGRKDLLRILGNITDENIKTNLDDGISQTVVVKTGIAKHEAKEIKNPILLCPLATFNEILPNESSYILRMAKGNTITASLNLCDGMQWEYDTRLLIKEYLESMVDAEKINAIVLV